MRDNVFIQELAERLFKLIDPWDRDYNSADDIASDIKDNPDVVIEYLIELLEEA